MLKTILTYLELDGFLRAGHAVLRGLQLPPDDAARSTTSSRRSTRRARASSRRLVASGKTGRIWTSLDPDAAAAALGEDREPDRRRARLPRGAGARRAEADRCAAALHAARAARLRRRAARPARRALRAARAGRDRADRAGRLARHARRLPGERARRLLRRGARRAVRPLQLLPHRRRRSGFRAPEPPPPIETLVDRGALAALAATHPDALGAPRQRARFLCGITSPATTPREADARPALRRARDRRFADVLPGAEDGRLAVRPSVNAESMSPRGIRPSPYTVLHVAIAVIGSPSRMRRVATRSSSSSPSCRTACASLRRVARPPTRRLAPQGGRDALPHARRAAAADHVRRLSVLGRRVGRRSSALRSRRSSATRRRSGTAAPTSSSSISIPTTASACATLQAAARETGEPLDIEYRFIARRTGATSGCGTATRSCATTPGAPWYSQGFALDITARKQAERRSRDAAHTGAGAERAAPRARPREGRVHRARVARAPHAADVDPRLPRARRRRRRGDRPDRRAA